MLVQVLFYGLMTGLVYALIAVGLGLSWSVLGVINFAHGEFLLWGLYAAFGLWSLFALDPLLAIPLAAALIALLALAVYRSFVGRVVGAPGLTALLATFGLSILLKNLAQVLFTSNTRRVSGTLFDSSTLRLGSLYLRQDYLAAGLGSLALVLVVLLLINRSELGVQIRATGISRDTTELMGINTGRIYAITFALSGACVGAAAALMLPFAAITPTSCTLYSILAFIIVAMSGLGNIRATLLGGIAVGLLEALSGYFFGSAFRYFGVFILFLVVLQFRPGLIKGWRA